MPILKLEPGDMLRYGSLHDVKASDFHPNKMPQAQKNAAPMDDSDDDDDDDDDDEEDVGKDSHR